MKENQQKIGLREAIPRLKMSIEKAAFERSFLHQIPPQNHFCTFLYAQEFILQS